MDFPITSEAALMAVSADGTVLITGDYGGVRVWSLETMDQLRTISSTEMYLNAAALSPDGHTVALGDGTGNKITVWDTRTGTLLRTLLGHTDWPLALAFSPDGKTLISGARDVRGIVWDVHTGRRLKTVQGHRMPVTTVAVSPDGTQFATGSSDGQAVVWDIGSGRQVMCHDTSPLTVSKLAFAPVQPYLVVVCEDIYTSSGEGSQMTGYAEARTVNLRTGLTLGATPTIATRITAVCFTAPDTYLLGDWDGNVSSVDLESGATIDEFRADEESYLVNELAWIPQKSTLLVADLNGVTALQSGKEQISYFKSSDNSLMPLQSHDGEVHSIVVMPDGNKLFSYGRDRKIIEYDLERDEVDGYVYATKG